MGIYTEHFNMTNKANNLAHHPQIITAPQDVESRLQGLTNLSLQDFAEIIQIANFARNDETANSTKTYAGTNFYHNLVKSLRNVLAAKVLQHTRIAILNWLYTTILLLAFAKATRTRATQIKPHTLPIKKVLSL